MVLPIHLAQGCKFAIVVAVSHNVQKGIAIVRDSDPGSGSLQGVAIISAAVVTRLHHDTATVC